MIFKEKIVALFPFKFLLDVSQAKTTYVLKSVVITAIPALLLSILLSNLFPESKKPEYSYDFLNLFFSIVLIAPIIETLLLAIGISILSKVFRSKEYIVLASSLLWALLHALRSPLHGVIVLWPFFVFSLAFLQWKKISTGTAILVGFAMHFGHNLFNVLLTISLF